VNAGSIAATLALFAVASFWLGRRRALRAVAADGGTLHSLPGHYGWYAALWCLLPGLVVAVAWLVVAPWALDRLTLAPLAAESASWSEERAALFLNDVKNAARGSIASAGADPQVRAAAERYLDLRAAGSRGALALAGVLSLAGAGLALRRIRPELAARVAVEQVARVALLAASSVAILVTIGVLLSLVFETSRFFQKVSPAHFLFGLQWSPQTALRADQVGSSGSFGAVPVFTGTLLITAIAMSVAAPIGLLSAVYMTFYARPGVRDVAKPVLEILAGVPTVVYGFFAALVVGPLVRGFGESLGLDVASESALVAGVVMGVMIIPFVSSLSDDAIAAVPQALSDGSLALGATRAETVRSVVIPAALPGIAGSLLLAVSRAIGETMIVVMAAGLSAHLTANPMQAVTTVTVQIVTLLTGDQEFDSAKTLSAFALGLVLFLATLVLNVIAIQIVRRYRERYE
jgi:phosphate transport system permease protein